MLGDWAPKPTCFLPYTIEADNSFIDSKVTFAYSIDRLVDCGVLITFSDFQLLK